MLMQMIRHRPLDRRRLKMFPTKLVNFVRRARSFIMFSFTACYSYFIFNLAIPVNLVHIWTRGFHSTTCEEKCPEKNDSAENCFLYYENSGKWKFGRLIGNRKISLYSKHLQTPRPNLFAFGNIVFRINSILLQQLQCPKTVPVFPSRSSSVSRRLCFSRTWPRATVMPYWCALSCWWIILIMQPVRVWWFR